MIEQRQGPEPDLPSQAGVSSDGDTKPSTALLSRRALLFGAATLAAGYAGQRVVEWYRGDQAAQELKPLAENTLQPVEAMTALPSHVEAVIQAADAAYPGEFSPTKRELLRATAMVNAYLHEASPQIQEQLLRTTQARLTEVLQIYAASQIEAQEGYVYDLRYLLGFVQEELGTPIDRQQNLVYGQERGAAGFAGLDRNELHAYRYLFHLHRERLAETLSLLQQLRAGNEERIDHQTYARWGELLRQTASRANTEYRSERIRRELLPLAGDMTGKRVLIIGYGTGVEFPAFSQAVGDEGVVGGVEIYPCLDDFVRYLAAHDPRYERVEELFIGDGPTIGVTDGIAPYNVVFQNNVPLGPKEARQRWVDSVVQSMQPGATWVLVQNPANYPKDEMLADLRRSGLTVEVVRESEAGDQIVYRCLRTAR